MDITDHPHLAPSGLKTPVSVSFPDQPTHKDEVEAMKALLDPASLRNYNNILTSFFNRYYTSSTGLQAAQRIQNEFTNLGQNLPNVDVSFFTHARFGQPSVIARFAGSGPLADEIVIIGAHLDSTSGSPSRISPGADDDASGTSTLLEVFRALASAQWKPKRTVEFQAYAAEEAGLLGSQDIAARYQQDGKKVYAMMQLDMTMYNNAGRNQIGIVTDFVSPDLTAFVRILIDTYCNLGWVDTRCGYACSDHASWFRAGYASCFPFEGPFGSSNPYIHTPDDVITHLSIDHGMEFAYLAMGFLVELASE
jgi:leucyl aminopeptidase